MIENLLRLQIKTEKQVQDLENVDVVPVVARYTRGTAQSIPNNTTTIVDFDTLDIDTTLAVTTGASWQFVAPVAGYYQVDAHISFASTANWADGEVCQISVFKNGATAGILGFSHNNPTNTQASVGGGTVVHLAKGDTIDIRVAQVSGAALNTQAAATHCWVAIHRIKG